MQRTAYSILIMTTGLMSTALADSATFEDPVRLIVDREPLNAAAKQMYPSPAWYDVDNDGKVELVVGDISGSMNVYENTNDGEGDPVWAKHEPLKTANGQNIRVSNW